MNISTTSWHYRFQEEIGTHPAYRNNLCAYMRGLVFACAQCLMFGFIGAGALWLALVLIYTAFYTLIGGWLGWETYTSPQWYLGLACWTVVSVVGINHIRQEMQMRRVFIPKPVSPFVQYVKDKHGNVCRMITFTD